ncbi:MAG TPA: M56 family metallopeptidase [Vicinamibacteria bacterium]|nr:M56 family metallopeptidase [Vicinamibacteria bacterium]
MSAATFLANLVAHSAQVAVVVVAGAGLARLTRLRAAVALLGWWRLLLLVSLLLPVLQPWTGPPIPVAGGETLVTDGASGHGAALPWAGAIVVLLAGGTALRLARLALGLARLRRWRKGAAPAEDHLDAGMIAGAVREAGAKARLCLTSAVEVPATYGTLRPVVLLPQRMLALPPSGQLDVLLHELRHVRRADWSAAVFEELIAALLWFHPAVAWLRARIRLTRELVVDAEVVARTGERRRYLETLLAFARADGVPPPAAALFSPPHLESRVDALMKEDTMPRTRTWAALAASAAVVALAGAAVVTAVPLRSRGAAEASATAPKRTLRERKIVQKVQPAYPADAKKSGIEGRVVLDVLITAAGDVTDVKVVKGPEELREAAAAAVRQWKYAPGDVDTRANLTIRYILDKKDRAER